MKCVLLLSVWLGAFGGLSAGVAPAQKIGINKTACTIADIPDLDSTYPDPSPQGSIGPQQVITAVNSYIQSFDKTTGEPDGILDISLKGFFGREICDPLVRYDRFSERWFIIGRDGVNFGAKNLYIAMSDGPLITNCCVWSMFELASAVIMPGAKDGRFDCGFLGVDQNALYITGRVAQYINNLATFTTSLIVIPKETILNGSPVPTVFANLAPGNMNSKLWPAYLIAVENYTANPRFGYIIGPDHNSYDNFLLYRVAYTGTTPTIYGPISIPIAPFVFPGIAPCKGMALITTKGVYVKGCVLVTAHIRDHILYTAHAVGVDSNGVSTATADRSGCRWYAFDLAPGGIENPMTVPRLVQNGTLFDSAKTTSPLWYYTPSIMTNPAHDLTLCCNVSGKNAYIDAVAAGRKVSDPLGTLRPPIYVTHSANPYNMDEYLYGAAQMWGFYSSSSPDDATGDIWTFQEWAAVTNGWGIQMTQLKPKGPDVFKPSKLAGRRIAKPQKKGGAKHINILTWDRPAKGNYPVKHLIYSDKNLTQLIGEIPAAKKLVFKDRKVKKNKAYTYYVVSVDLLGNRSEPAWFTIAPSLQ